MAMLRVFIRRDLMHGPQLVQLTQELSTESSSVKVARRLRIGMPGKGHRKSVDVEARYLLAT